MTLIAYVLDSPEEKVSKERLTQLGCLHWKLDPAKHENDPELDRIRKERKYTFNDEISSDKIPNLAEKLDNFMIEHIHDDEEIRYFLDGSGYFDVRDGLDAGERWIRVHCQPGDMMVLPAGIYHRFVPDDKMKFHVMRLFQGEPVWTPHNRKDKGTAEREARKEYEAAFLKKEEEEAGEPETKKQKAAAA